jgi:hypothetical protein
MSKTTKMILVGVGVAVVLVILFNVALSLDGENHLGTALTGGVGGGIAAAFIYGGLLGNRKIANASDGEKKAALDRQPPAGKGLLYVYREGFAAKLAGLNISVDGTAVAQLKSPRFTCVVVGPGVHTLTAAFGGVAAVKASECQVAVAADGAAAVRIGFNMVSGLSLTPQTDMAAAKQKLAGMPMTPPDLGEVA